MNYETIEYEVSENILTITLNRPDKLNAFNGPMMAELIDALDKADADDEVRAIIVTGAGRAFCAGADLSSGARTFDFAARQDRPDQQGTPIKANGELDWSHESVRDRGGRVSLRIYECLKPVIAAVNGAAVGVGVTMQLPMDIRIASEDARFGFVFNRRGITPEACSSWFLPRLVGISKALEWMYTGRLFSAQEALQGGLVQQVCKPEELLPAARALAREIVDNSAPVSVALTRQMLWRMLGTEATIIPSSSLSSTGFQAGVIDTSAAIANQTAANIHGTHEETPDLSRLRVEISIKMSSVLRNN